MELLYTTLLGVLLVSGIFSTLIGLVTLVQFARNKRLPADESNRINHIRLWWFVLTRPELFVNAFPWLKHDEYNNIKDKI
jgi:predicted CDP-diglyceride synthetase/phosphatidate cytidylyltransferase